MPTSPRWPVPAKFLLRRPDGKWMSYDQLVVDFVLKAPRGFVVSTWRTLSGSCRANSTSSSTNSSQPARSSEIVALPAGGRIERIEFAPRRLLLGYRGLAHRAPISVIHSDHTDPRMRALDCRAAADHVTRRCRKWKKRRCPPIT